MTQDLYAALGLNKAADREAVRKAYRAKAKLLHPDKGGDPAAFALISLANTVLTDEERRKAYDETGSIDHRSIEAERASILEIIAGAIQATVQQAQQDPSTFDFLAQVRVNINRKIQEGDQALANHNINLAKFDSIIKRCKTKKKAADSALLAILAQHRATVAAALAADTATVARFKKALDLLKDYSYEFTVKGMVGMYDIYQQQTNTFGRFK